MVTLQSFPAPWVPSMAREGKQVMVRKFLLSGNSQTILHLRGIKDIGETIQELYSVDMYTLPTVLSTSNMICKKASWLMADNSRLPGTKQVVSRIHEAMPNIATILDTSAMVIDACLDVANIFCRPLNHKVNLPSHGRSNKGPFKCSPKVTCIAPPYGMDGSPRSVPIFLPDTSKMGLSYWWLNANTWRFASAAENIAGLAETSGKEKIGKTVKKI